MTKSYVTFEFIDALPKRRTLVWLVKSTSGNFLGTVKWYTSWRCYCFFPASDTLYNVGCLRDIASFCHERTREHNTALRRKRMGIDA